MAKWSQDSLDQLATVDIRLVHLFNEVVKNFDCKVLEGKRDVERQMLNVQKGVSKTMNSKHVYPLGAPSLAVDVAPYPLRWPNRESQTYVKDVARFYLFAGYVKAHAEALGLNIRWGGDWDMDWDILDQVFDDLVHFEIKEVDG